MMKNISFKKNTPNLILICLINFFLHHRIVMSAEAPFGLYQVITSHSHDLEKIEKYIDYTYLKDGRMWLVHLKPDTPKQFLSFFRPADLWNNYSFEYIPQEKSQLSSHQYSAKTTKMEMEKVLSSVDLKALNEEVVNLSQFNSRLAGSIENQDATQYLLNKLGGLNYKTYLQCYQKNQCNVVAEKKGFQHSDEIIIIEAHFDSVGKAQAGADDNASGVSALMEIARILSTQVTNRTIHFLLTNGEEAGLHGAYAYVKKLESENKIKSTKLVINMDMVGFNSNGIVELETDPAFAELANWYGNLVSQYTKLNPKITLGAWGSDHVPFLQKNIPSLLTIEDWNTKTPCYHLACDKPSTINYAYMAEITKLNLAAIIEMDK